MTSFLQKWRTPLWIVGPVRSFSNLRSARGTSMIPLSSKLAGKTQYLVITLACGPISSFDEIAAGKTCPPLYQYVPQSSWYGLVRKEGLVCCDQKQQENPCEECISSKMLCVIWILFDNLLGKKVYPCNRFLLLYPRVCFGQQFTDILLNMSKKEEKYAIITMKGSALLKDITQ